MVDTLLHRFEDAPFVLGGQGAKKRAGVLSTRSAWIFSTGNGGLTLRP